MRFNLSHRWRKAQISEEKCVRTRKEIHKWESTQGWNAVLQEEFFTDFSSFVNKRVLEVGCGCSGPIHYINRPCFNVGIDPLLHNYKDLLDSASTTHLVTSIVEKLPFKDGSFDIVLCVNTLDHVMDPQAALREIRRVMVPGAPLLLKVHVFSSLPKWARGNLYLIDRPHPFHFSEIEVLSSLEQAGFTILNYKEMRFKDKGCENARVKARIPFWDQHAFKVLVARILGIRQLVVRVQSS